MHGVYAMRSIGAYKAAYTPAELNSFLWEVDATEDYTPFPPEWQVLSPWTDKDMAFFDLRKTPAPRADPPKRSPPQPKSRRNEKPSDIENMGRMEDLD